MDLRRLLLSAALGLLALPVASAADEPFRTLQDTFVDVRLEDMIVAIGCAAGAEQLGATVAFDAETDSFTFREGEGAVGGTVPEYYDPGPAMVQSQCATVAIELAVPAGTDHVHVRFDADRRIAQPVSLDYHMPQELRLLDAVTDETIATVEVFAWDEGPRDRTRHAELGVGEAPFFPIPGDVTKLRIEWYFEDKGQSFSRDGFGAVSGQTFSATVWDPVVEFSAAPAYAQGITRSERRDGLTIHTDTRVPLDYVPGGNATNLRVRAPLESQFSHLITPGGARLDATGSLFNAEYGPDARFVAIDRNSAEGYVEISIPHALLAPHGTGTYWAVFTEVSTVAPSSTALSINAVLAALPLALAAMAVQRIREFQREAFGGYRRTASKLMLTVGLVLAYYVVAMLGAMLAGWFVVAAAWPPTRITFLLYLQIALAMAAFWWLWLTGREMYRIIRPVRATPKA